MNFYSIEPEQILEKLSLPKNYLETGLTTEEIESRSKKYGKNELPKVSKGFFKVYLAPLFNWLIVIYLIGSGILYLATLLGREGSLTMVYLTLGIVFINCMVAVFQQFRATKKLKALRELGAPTTTVIRDEQRVQILSRDVVVGDLLVINQGDRIPADARVIRSSYLEMNEASLTGESEPVKKNSSRIQISDEKEIPIVNRHNMVFYGTYATMGNGMAIVVNIGISTEIGKISKGLEESGTSEIPIQKKMNNFGKWLGLLTMGFWVVILLIIWISTGRIDVFKSLNSAMDIMPINIPLLTTIVLITGVLAMAQRGVIIRNLTSVDSLGRVSVVCSDKTGTLTKNQMCIQHIWTDNSTFDVTGTGYAPIGKIFLRTSNILSKKNSDNSDNLNNSNNSDKNNLIQVQNIGEYPQLKLLLISGYLNNNATLLKHEIKNDSKKVTENWTILGSPTEGALSALYKKVMNDSNVENYEILYEYPFNSKLKRMTKLAKDKSIPNKKQVIAYTKGASEIIIPLCSKILNNSQIEPFTDELRNKIMDKINFYAESGYRILSLCYKIIDDLPENFEETRDNCESEMSYIGFVTISDPPREGVKKSVEQCHNAGIDVVMITGDSPITAKAIASQISIVRDSNSKDALEIVEGKDIHSLIESGSDFNKFRVFARVSPEHKQDIVLQYQKEKRIVAMTGDGVNDALALNMADAGISMGIQGTDVAKEASDMIISDDSFNSIVDGIRHGRGIFARVRAMVFFYICINIFEGLVQFILVVILNMPYFLDDLFYYQWIFLSITLHTFPGLILTFDTTPKDVMKEKPRDSEEILSKKTIMLMLIFGGLLAVSMLVTYFLVINGLYPLFPGNTSGSNFLYSPQTLSLTPGVSLTSAKALTMLMTTLYFCESFLVFQIRRPNKFVLKAFKEDSNKFMYVLMFLLYFIYLSLMYIPRLQLKLASWHFNFMFMRLTGLDWLVCFLISLICIGGFELAKYIARKKNITF